MSGENEQLNSYWLQQMHEDQKQMRDSQMRVEMHIESIAKSTERIAKTGEGIEELSNKMNDKMDGMKVGCQTVNVEREKKYWIALSILLGIITVILFVLLGIEKLPKVMGFISDLL